MCSEAASGITVVLGIGNLLRQDEGVGVHVAQRLLEADLPEGVEVLDGGTAPTVALDAVGPIGRLIVVDAVDAGAEPGTVFRLRPHQVETKSPVLSLHELPALELFAWARNSQLTPERIEIVAVQPRSMDWGTELSPPVAAAAERVVQLLMTELGRAVLTEGEPG